MNTKHCIWHATRGKEEKEKITGKSNKLQSKETEERVNEVPDFILCFCYTANIVVLTMLC